MEEWSIYKTKRAYYFINNIKKYKIMVWDLEEIEVSNVVYVFKTYKPISIIDFIILNIDNDYINQLIDSLNKYPDYRIQKKELIEYLKGYI